MKKINFNSQLKDYELTYWKAHKTEYYGRPTQMKEIFKDYLIKRKIAIDVGCGPYCGIFNELKFPEMYAIDPLWPEYNSAGLTIIPENVQTIATNAESFKLKKKAGVAFSINALDHSGSLISSVKNIMDNLRKKGRFFFHVHLRTVEQLNTGHLMVVTEKELDDLFNNYNVLWKKILEECPFDHKKYKSYITVVEKI